MRLQPLLIIGFSLFNISTKETYTNEIPLVAFHL